MTTEARSAALARDAEVAIPSLDESVRLRDGAVWLLDRRAFPARVAWVRATTAVEVADAIRGMVTQSSGPLFATTAAMELAALQAAGLPFDAARAAIDAAGAALVAARPTNTHPGDAVDAIRRATLGATDTRALVARTVEAARAHTARYRARSRALGAHAVALLPDGARILTHCWMDTYLIELVRAAERAGRSYDWVVTETRPYLQGARLTAHTLREMGQPVTLITDGMGAAAMAPGASIGRIDALVTAADRVALDGSVANKVGTLGLAIAARAFGVPFSALAQAPDASVATGADIRLEARDPDEVLHTLDRRTASPLVSDAWYPAFDVTPPAYVSRIVTDRGPFAPADLAQYFAAADLGTAPAGTGTGTGTGA